MKWDGTKKRIVFWVVFSMILEAIIVLWPLVCAISGNGYLEIWQTGLIDGPIRNPAIGLVFGVISALVFGLVYGLVYGLVFGLASGLIVALGSNITIVLGYGLLFGLVFGLVFSFGYGLIFGIILGLIFGFARGIVIGPGVAVAILFGMILIHWLRQSTASNTSFSTWLLGTKRLQKHYFLEIVRFLCKAVAFFIVIYLGIVLVFSLWFYAFYLEDTSSFYVKYTEGADTSHWWDFGYSFRSKDAALLNWWDFAYYSLMSITSFGSGDIYPVHTFPQFLEMLELVMELGWILAYFGIILNVVRKMRIGKRKKTVR